jgi:hypothetical protein
VNLDIRPLSPYRKQLLDAIDDLRIKSWSDRQIADHFNLIGLLTPRGHRWLPQSVFSMRKKREMALAKNGSVKDVTNRIVPPPPFRGLLPTDKYGTLKD